MCAAAASQPRLSTEARGSEPTADRLSPFINGKTTPTPSSGEVSHRSARQRLRISMNEHSEAVGHGVAEPPVGGVTRRSTPAQVHAAVSAWCAG